MKPGSQILRLLVFYCCSRLILQYYIPLPPLPPSLMLLAEAQRPEW